MRWTIASAKRKQSIADLLAAAKAQNVSPMDLSERIIDGDKLPVGIKPALKRNLANFVGIVRKLRRAAERVSSRPASQCLSSRVLLSKNSYG